MIPDSARFWRVGEDVSSSRTFGKIVSARRLNQHPRRVRYPGVCAFLLIGFVCLTGVVSAAEVIPPKPQGYFADYASVVSQSAALRFNEQLAQFERETSNQIWVVVYPKMQSDSDIADYTQRVAQSWGVGQKDRRNGAVFFVFVQDKKTSLQVGYGLEGALPDIIAYDIRKNRVGPHLRQGDFEGGIAEGIDSIIKAIRGEYKGSGKTAFESRQRKNAPVGILPFIVFVIILIILARLARKQQGYSYTSRGGGPIFIPMGGGGWSSGGGGSGGGGGGFSESLGGGGSFGGGGSSGDW